MDETMLTVVKNGEVGFTPEAERTLVTLSENLKLAKEQYDEFVSKLQAAMEAEGLIKIETPWVRVNYIAETDREKFDSKALRAELPDIYDNYTKLTKVKASVRVTVL